MAGPWNIIVPEAGTNMVLNPSAEAAGNFGASGGATVTQDTTYARFGYQCFKVVPGGTARGMTLVLSALANATTWVTFYARGVSGTLSALLNGVTANTCAVIGGSTGGWLRYGVQISGAQASASVSLLLRNSANETWYVDGVQVEQLSYYTTYIDGDQGPLYRWSGLRNGSTSTRDAQDRSGGRKRNLLDDYGLKVRQELGAGLPGVENNYIANALLPGSTFQNAKVDARTMTLIFELHSGDGAVTGLHSKRKQLIDLIKSEAVRGNQAFILGYTGANASREVYGRFRYDDGLRLGKIAAGPTHVESNGAVPVALIAEDPFFYEDSSDTTLLDFTDSLASSTGGTARIAGAWQNLGSGFNDSAYCVLVDPLRGRVYFGGLFTTANGVTVNGICYYDGSTFVAMDGGVNVSSGASRQVWCMALAPNGDLWVGGSFTTVGSGAAATKGLARWNIATGTWTAFNESTSTFTYIRAIAVDSNSVVYIGGLFTNWEGDANSDNICKTSDNGVNWDSMGTGCNSTVLAMLAHPDGKLYVGGLFTTGNSVTLNGIGYWSGSTFVALIGTATGLSGGSAICYALALARNGMVYVGGDFSAAGGVSCANIALWTGAVFQYLGGSAYGPASPVFALAVGADGMLYIGGDFTQVGTTGNYFTSNYLVLWNGSALIPTDLKLGTGLGVFGIAEWQPGNIFLARFGTGTATCGGRVTVTTTSKTVSYPIITIVGPSSGSAILQWIENQSAGFRLYFYLTIYAGEVITLNLTPDVKTIVSSWRGQLNTQPLGASDWATFALLPGANTVEAFLTGTTTDAVIGVTNWPAHQALDMVAA